MALQYFSKEGLENLKNELHQLKTVERPKISQQIAEARDKGDLSENAEYDAAKEAQGLLEHKISQMQQILGNARVIDESQMDISKVMVLNKVKVKNHKTNAVVNYQLVSEKEADLKTGKISVKSPIGIALLGKVVGEKVDVTVPAGVITLEILEISI
jgi:transcription elongation factor GreA